eukprot:CAMPEP_0197022684 /NCGR_PEP_ID=MMETSP1384-20130603/3496_1 /TAXON_ID=29189 /ORGANISM="Ammonia sp." /LENGTH=214 /DNA_ID=CAMNT_0042450769 /DNA_START=90 /DNA_END=734 /DNA_ORIENTATION=+
MIFPLYIKTINGKTIRLDVEPNDTIENLKTQIRDKEGILPQSQRLIHSGRKLKDDKTLSEYNINAETTLYLVMKLGWSRSIKLSQSTAKTIYVKTLHGQSFALNVEPICTVLDVKQKISQQHGIPVDSQRLLFTGQSLSNGLTLSDYNIIDGCTLHIVFRRPLEALQSDELDENSTPNDSMLSLYSVELPLTPNEKENELEDDMFAAQKAVAKL